MGTVQSLDESKIKELSGSLQKMARLANLASREDAGCCGVTVSQCHILLSLLEARETNMRALSHELGIAPSTLTRNIEPLITSGWVRREPSGEDRRQVVVRLSMAGRLKASQLKSLQTEFCMRLIERLPVEDRQGAVDALSAFLSALEGMMHGECCPR